MQHPDSSATLRYTLDNSLPTASSPLYTSPFTLIQSAAVRTKAFESGFNDSVASSATFIIRPPVIFLGNGSFSNGQFQAGISGLSGKSYLFQTTTNFYDWVTLSTNIAGANIFNVVDPGASNFSYRFYRVIEQP